MELGIYTFVEATPDAKTGHLISPEERLAHLMEEVTLADQVGLDICKHVAEILGLGKSEMTASKLARLVAEGKLGKKSGEGFYRWVDGNPVAK